MTSPETVSVLILGAGWTSRFLIPLLEQENISYAATTTTGRDGTIAFRFEPGSNDKAPYARLPHAQTIIITFPLKGTGQSALLTTLYGQTHKSETESSATRQWIQLGSSGIFTGDGWVTSKSPYDTDNFRAVAEDELMYCAKGCVLNLCGLYDGTTRDPRNWLNRVAKTKDELAAKGALHLIHGVDVARAIVALHRNFTPITRWLVTDLHVYDWWDLAQGWEAELRNRRQKAPVQDGSAPELLYEQWVVELMQEKDVRALPRSIEQLGRILDGRDFWKAMGTKPSKALVREPGGKE